MVVNRKPTGRASSIGAGLAWAGASSLGITLAGSALVAIMVNTQYLKQNNLGYGIMVVLILASWMGALVAWKKIKRRRMLICLAAGGVYFGILMLMTALFFGARYSGVGETALLILCGSMLAVLCGIGPKQKQKIRKIPKHNW